MADTGIGAALAYGDTSGSITNVLGCVTSITVPQTDVTVAQVSCLDTATRRKLSKPGMADEGTMDFEVVYSEDQFAALHSLVAAEKWWKVTFPGADPLTIVFQGFLSKLDCVLDADNIMKSKISVKVTESVTVDDGAT